jgi:hypothetical protein
MATAAAVPGQSFEVAAIRPLDAVHGFKLHMMFARYRISGGPDRLDKDVWDVTAKAEGFAGET